MPATLENSSFHLLIDPSRNLFSVQPRQANVPAIQQAHFSVRYRYGSLWQLQEAILPGEASEISLQRSVHGELRGRTMRYGPNRHGLVFELTFAMPREHPLLLWKMRVVNGGSRRVQIGKMEMLRVGFAPIQQASETRPARAYPRGEYRFELRDADPAFFSNGWGSWNHTGALGFLEKFRKTRFRWFNGPMRINPGTPQPGGTGHFASDMFAVLGDRTNRGGLLIGFLSQKQHFGSMEALLSPLTPALSLWANGDAAYLDPGASVATDWACMAPIHLDAPDPLGPYLEAVMREHGLYDKEETEVPVGWCSWYQYFQDIQAPVIRRNLDAASRFSPTVPLQLFQIDDGWQKQIGDWSQFSPGFPDGPAPLASDIRSRGMVPGLWLAPFIVHPKSDLAKEHPDWILRNRWGLPVNAGFVWNTFTRALDLSIPAALEGAVESIRRAANEWGYPYLKLDFLYAGALAGRRADQSRTRAQILRTALEEVREAVGDGVDLLACGCPLGPAIGLFDAMRINADVAPQWFPGFMGHERIFRREPDFPSARNAIQNALTRAPMHNRLWINDPDCLLLRPDSDLSLAEVQSLATVIALTGGSLLLSDDLTALPDERLRIAQRLLPLIGRRAHVTDWFDRAMPARVRLDLDGPAGRWHLLAAFNWSEDLLPGPLQTQDFHLDLSSGGYARSFWTGEVFRIENGLLPIPPIEPHGCILVAVRSGTERVQYLGSDLHISQGMELTEWQVDSARLAFVLERPGPASGEIVLKLPAEPVGTGHRILEKDVYAFRVELEGKLAGEIRFG